MAKAGGKSAVGTKVFTPRPKRKRSGVVSKNNTSNIKGSRNYKKKYKGQGR
jgi:hypothetical protein